MKRHPKLNREPNWVEICCFGCTCLQLHWPKAAIKKWLNRGSHESDFSADEGDSGTEFDDEEAVGSDVDISDDEDARSEMYPSKVRRRKSETLRAQYINAKEIRVCASSWNVGGKMPPDDLDISDWLDKEEPADIYVIGLQEIVPLNAGNIFGTEDIRPVRKWKYLIRETLNKIRPFQTRFKCHSDPSSPSRFKPSDDMPEIEDGILPETDSENETEVHPLDEKSFSFSSEKDAIFSGEANSFVDADLRLKDDKQQPSSRKLNRLNCLNLTNDDLTSDTPVDQPEAKLNRMLSCSERIGLSWPEQPLDLVPRLVLDSSKSFKSMQAFTSSKSFKFSMPENGNKLSETILAPDDDLKSRITRKRSAYVRIVSKQMVGIFLSIWVRRNLRKHIQNLKVSTVGVGVMGYIGNKGSISVSMSIYQTLFCFVCTHLTSGEKEGDQVRRNADVQEIHRRTLFNTNSTLGFPKTIRDHERVIWLGDLNYRISLSYEKAREFIFKKEWSKLLERDQLIRELKKGRAFDGWSEGTVNFPPTYKFESNSDKYVGDDPKAGRRTPAWCDRILTYGKGMRLLKYRMINQRLSDHRPVSATIIVEVEVFSQRKLQRALTFTNAELNETEVSKMGIGIAASDL